jgi:hypothetical protein
MKLKSILFFCIQLGLFMTFSACVKDSDMGTENTFESSSVLTSNLISSKLGASAFLEEFTNQERAIRIDTTYLEWTSSAFLMDQWSQTNLTFKIKNSIEREFKMDVEFMNDLDEVKFSFQIPVSPGTKQKPITVETNVVIETPELVTFKEATKLVYKIALLPNDLQLMPESEGTLELQSDAAYFLYF